MKKLMKITSVFLVILLIHTSIAFAKNDYMNGVLQAKTDVANEYSSWYNTVGFIGGILFGLIGTGIVWAAASGDNPSTEKLAILEAEDKSSDYINGYLLAYKEATAEKNKNAALLGGLGGTLVIILVYTTR